MNTHQIPKSGGPNLFVKTKRGGKQGQEVMKRPKRNGRERDFRTSRTKTPQSLSFFCWGIPWGAKESPLGRAQQSYWYTFTQIITFISRRALSFRSRFKCSLSKQSHMTLLLYVMSAGWLMEVGKLSDRTTTPTASWGQCSSLHYYVKIKDTFLSVFYNSDSLSKPPQIQPRLQG